MFSANLIKGLAISLVFLFLVGCGGAAKGGSSARSTAPTAEQIEQMNAAQAAATAAEEAHFQKKSERIQLERQLEDQQ